MTTPNNGLFGAPTKNGGVDGYVNVGIPFERTVEDSSGVKYKQRCIYLYSTAAVDLGDAVGFDRADTTYGFGHSVKPSPAVLASTFEYVGAALSTLTAAGLLLVALSGYAQVNTENEASAAAGGRFIVDVGNAGEYALQSTAAAADVMAGIFLAAETAGTPDLTPALLKDQGWF